MNQKQEIIFSTILLTIAVGLAVLFGFMAWFNSEKASLVLIAAAGSLLFAFAPKLKSFKLGVEGVSAEMRELVERGEGVAKKLEQLTIINAQALIALAFSDSGYVEQYNDADRDYIYQLARSTLQSAGTTNDEQRVALTQADDYFDSEYIKTILMSIVARRAEGQFPEFLSMTREDLTPTKFREVLTRENHMHPITKDWIDDLEYWRLNKEHRRPDYWSRRKSHI